MEEGRSDCGRKLSWGEGGWKRKDWSGYGWVRMGCKMRTESTESTVVVRDDGAAENGEWRVKNWSGRELFSEDFLCQNRRRLTRSVKGRLKCELQ